MSVVHRNFAMSLWKIFSVVLGEDWRQPDVLRLLPFCRLLGLPSGV
jgi:hypothetical protein